MAFTAVRPLKAILDDADFGDEPQLFACNASPARVVAGGDVTAPNYRCECAGAAFADRYDFPGRSAKEGSPKSSGASDDVDSDEGEDYGGKSKGGKDKATGALKLSEVLKGVNLYELMGVSEGATQDEIKKAYRNLCLTCHPDKQASLPQAEAKKVQERFVQIQEAYELLSDTAKRMQYDSSLDFDESLPKFKPDLGEDFYEVFGECFRRNARFSSKRPVPDIGGPDSKPEEWKRFYNFWHEFQSWRDPLVLAAKDGEDELYDLNDAECREEKRWMMKENNKIAKTYKQAERDRIADLVRRAEQYDPRILAEKEAKKAAREAELARRQEEKMAVVRAKEEAERKKREAEEAARKAEAEKKAQEKAVRDAAKEKVKKCRQRLRSFHPHFKHLVLLEQLNEVCLQFEEAGLRKLGDQVEAALKKDVDKAASLIHAAIETLGMKAVTSVKEEEDTQSTSSGDATEEVVLSPEEQRALEQRQREAEKKRAEEEKRKEEERARLAAEKAEQKKIKDEQRKREQAQAEAKKRQQEKKEEEKAKKAGEKAKKAEEEEALRKEKKKEEDRQRSLEQAEKDRQEAAARKEEMESERVAQLFAADRLDRLQKLDHASEQDLAGQLEQAYTENASLAAALRLLQANSAAAGTEAMVDKAMALVSKVGPVWPLALAPPASVKLPNAVRNRVKKARQRLRDLAVASFPKLAEAGGSEADVVEWQRGIIDGSIELPTWSLEEKEAEDKEKEAQKAQAEKDKPAAAGKKNKKVPKEPSKGEEDLDELLAEFGVTPTPKKGGGKKKK